MKTMKMTLQLPDRLAQQAEDAGLLSPERIVDLIEREIEVNKSLTAYSGQWIRWSLSIYHRSMKRT